MIYYGCFVHQGVSDWNTYGQQYLTVEKLKEYKTKWKMNTLGWQVWWRQFEPSYDNPQAWNEKVFDRLAEMIKRTKQAGLIPVITCRIDYGTNDSQYGWASMQYVNNDEGRIYKGTDTWASGGRARYARFIFELAKRFPDVRIDPWHFPYHSTSCPQSDIDNWNNVTFPLLLLNCRNAGNKAPFFMVPVHQKPANMRYAPYNDPYGVVYAGGGHTVEGEFSWGKCNQSDSRTGSCPSTEEMKAYVDQRVAPLFEFRERNPNVEMCAMEFGAIGCRQEERPADQARLDALEYACSKYVELKGGWLYHVISMNQTIGNILLGATKQEIRENFEPDMSILSILQKYMLTTGNGVTPELDANLIVIFAVLGALMLVFWGGST